jgi:hypothetical protein
MRITEEWRSDGRFRNRSWNLLPFSVSPLWAEAVWKRSDDAGFAIGTGQFRRGRGSGGKSAYGHASE